MSGARLEPLANVTCVALADRGLMIEGPPGSGKSTLALMLIDRGAQLVGDDGVMLERRGGDIWTHPPDAIRGLIEIRGAGIVEFPAVSARPVAVSVRFLCFPFPFDNNLEALFWTLRWLRSLFRYQLYSETTSLFKSRNFV